MADEDTYPAMPCPPPKTPIRIGVAQSEEVEMDIGLGVRKYRWSYSGCDPPVFEWESADEGEWYPLLGKTKFREVLDMINERDGRDWGQPSHPKEHKEYKVAVWQRHPINPKAQVDELKFEGEFPISPEKIFQVLHEECYRSTWDKNMKKGYNITRFTRNNDIGYYEAILPYISNRDFCNQRGWIEMGKNEYLICNQSRPHKKMPHQKHIVRGHSFITCYYVRPSADRTGSILTYVTCADPVGSIPKFLINMITHSKGPGSLVGLYEAAKSMDAFLQDSYAKSQAAGGGPIKGPWDNTLEFPNTFIPRNPEENGAYRVHENPLDKEAKQFKALSEQEAQAEEEIQRGAQALFDQELSERQAILEKEGGPARNVTELRQQYEGDATAVVGNGGKSSPQNLSPVAQVASDAQGRKLSTLEEAVRNAEEDNRRLKERLAVFSRTSGADPLTRVPAHEPAVCTMFRKKIAGITDTIAIELGDSGRLRSITTEDYLSIVLARLEKDYPLPQTAVRQVCPSSHMGTPYDQLTSLVEYKHYPNMTEVCIVIIAFIALLASHVVNIMTVIYCFVNSLWPLGCYAVSVVIIGDLCTYWCCRDTHYKDKPFSEGGKAMPLLWPVRLQLIPIIPAQALMLLKRVPKEMSSLEVRPTHANLVYRFSFFYCLLRVFLHNVPMMYIWAIAEYKTNERENDGKPGFFSQTYWLIVLIHNIVFPTWILLWMFFLGFSPMPRQNLNICGLPHFTRWGSTLLLTLFFLALLGGASVPVLFDDRTWEYLD